jgi:hypothetical protein
VKKETRGRKTLLNTNLQKRICGYLSDCCTIRTACEATGISETSFFEWIRRGEAGEQPFAQFAQAVTRARGKAKAAIVRSLVDERDWRARLELLARVFPDEYGRRETAPLPPQPPQPPSDLSRSIRFTCGDVDLGRYMELRGELQVLEAQLKEIDALADFPMRDAEPGTAPAPESEANGRRPIVGAGGAV